MRKYIFVKGSIRVEDGVYRPVLDRETRGSNRLKVVLVRLKRQNLSHSAVEQAKMQKNEPDNASSEF